MWWLTREEREAASADLRAAGPAAQTLLRTLVREQTVTRNKASATARKLEDLGFCYVQDLRTIDPKVIVRPSLWGEDALRWFEHQKRKAQL